MLIFDIILFLVLAYSSFVFFSMLISAIERAGRPEPEQWHYPPLTVVIPAYNEEDTIERAIVSLLNSDYPSLEIIVVDDGSTDRTAEIASKYPVRLLRKKNQGSKAFALNYGIRHARTPLIATMDADSFVMPDTLKKAVRLFSDKDVWAVTGAIKAFGPDSFLTRLQYVDYSIILYTRKILEWLNVVHVTPGGFSIFRREVFDQLGLYDPRSLCEDHEIALRIVKAGKRIRSSLDAVVYTEVPTNWHALFKQRMRWLKGTIYDCFKHWDLFHLPLTQAIFIIPLDLSFTAFMTLTFFRALWDIIIKGVVLLDPVSSFIFFADWSTGIGFLSSPLTIIFAVLFYIAEEEESGGLKKLPLFETVFYVPFFVTFLSAVSVVSVLTLGDMRWEKSRAMSI